MTPASIRRLTLVLLVGGALSGCYNIRKEQLTQTLRVTTQPANAYVWTQDASGKQDVGQAPIEVKRSYTVTHQRFNHWHWLWTALFAGMIGAGAGLYVADDGSSTMSGQRIGGISLVTLGACLFLPSLIWTISGEVIGNKDFTGSTAVTIGASAPGHGDRWASLSVPTDQKELHISLSPAGEGGGAVLGGLMGSGKVARVFKASPTRPSMPIVAVFTVQDSSKRLAADLLDQLTEYLSAQLAGTARYRIVPRDRLRERLVDERRKSYRTCYDEACQIELGKAVAAQKSLSTRLLRVGERCAITAALFDLKTETTEAAASVDTTCSVEALLGAMRQVVKQLSR